MRIELAPSRRGAPDGRGSCKPLIRRHPPTPTPRCMSSSQSTTSSYIWSPSQTDSSVELSGPQRDTRRSVQPAARASATLARMPAHCLSRDAVSYSVRLTGRAERSIARSARMARSESASAARKSLSARDGRRRTRAPWPGLALAEPGRAPRTGCGRRFDLLVFDPVGPEGVASTARRWRQHRVTRTQREPRTPGMASAKRAALPA